MRASIIVASLILLLTSVGVKEAEAQMSSVSSGQTVNVNAHGSCRNVTNNGGATPMIPWNNATEWSYFISYKPSHISLSSCIIVEGPIYIRSNPYYYWAAYGNGDQVVWNGAIISYTGGGNRSQYSSGGWTYYPDYYVSGAGYPTFYAVRRERAQ